MKSFLANALVLVCLAMLAVPAFAQTAKDEYAATSQKKMLLKASETKAVFVKDKNIACDSSVFLHF